MEDVETHQINKRWIFKDNITQFEESKAIYLIIVRIYQSPLSPSFSVESLHCGNIMHKISVCANRISVWLVIIAIKRLSEISEIRE